VTLFNSITLFVMALTLWTAYARFRFRLASNWFGAYYAVLGGFWLGFDGSLNTWWLGLGALSALLLRADFLRGAPLLAVRAAELAFFAYVLWRGLALFLLW
jgi:hypothetical protein